ncbi:hypothetical protein PROFUN_06563 [Planoprotostelium fungivorum]|uniref:FZ domain-containing protein n=1 Tax=Planoprotostelium fungivorum TaxID=1890364 RepID=A0A2P6MRV0_9EUKA|nr:hypothetical protein PROFUN_06563 [Planoprotostelium fungivorum]
MKFNTRLLLCCLSGLIIVTEASVRPQMPSTFRPNSILSNMMDLRVLEECSGGHCLHYDVKNPGFCEDVMLEQNFTYCNCTTFKATDGINNDLYSPCGQSDLDALAAVYYKRFQDLRQFGGSREACNSSLKKLACYEVFKRCVDEEHPALQFGLTCRSVCYEAKNRCSLSIDCRTEFANTQCTGSDDPAVEDTFKDDL